METTKTSPLEEIDITQILKSIGNVFRNFGNSLLRGIAKLRRTFLSYLTFFIIVVMAATAFASFYSWSMRKQKFTSSMILSCDYLNTRIMENAIEKLNLLCLEKDRVGL